MKIIDTRNLGVSHSVGYNVEADRIEVHAGNDVAVELGPKGWFLGDQELRDLLVAKVHNVIRANLPSVEDCLYIFAVPLTISSTTLTKVLFELPRKAMETN